MSYNKSAVPLHLQSTDTKEAKDKNPSLESFRPSTIHHSNPGTGEMKGHIGATDLSRVRRYANGALDMTWTLHCLMTSLQKYESTGMMEPLEGAILTILFPNKYRFMDPAMAKIRTQLSKSEEAELRTLFNAKYAEILNFSGGMGGGTAPGRSQSF